MPVASLALFIWLLTLQSVTAAPAIVQVSPFDGEIMQQQPAQVEVQFDQPLDDQTSTFKILTPDGSIVSNTTATFNTTHESVTINLPTSQPEGVFTVVWHAVSVSDASVTDGWSSFGIGNSDDSTIVTVPTSQFDQESDVPWLETSARWLAMAGFAAMAALWPLWKSVIRPTLARNRYLARIVTDQIQRYALLALAVALTGSLLDLVAHSWHGVRLNTLFQTLTATDWGVWWLIRMALLIALGIGLALYPWWNTRRAPFKSFILWLLSLLLPIPFVLSGHANGDEVGRITTIAVTYLFLLAVWTLSGGMMWIAICRRISTELDIQIAARFRWLAVTSGMTLLVTGLYLAWLYVGTTDALVHTAFGRFALAALIIGCAIFIAIPLLKSSWRIAATAALLGTMLLLTIAGMQTHETARAQLLHETQQVRQDLSLSGRPGIMLMAPGQPGVNHLRLETPGSYVQTETEIFLDISNLNNPELGSKTLQMYRVQGNAFEHHGMEFSQDGTWQITVRVEEPGFETRSDAFDHAFVRNATTAQIPEAPWKFGDVSGLAGVSLVMVGILGIATAVTIDGPLRREAGGLAGVAIALALVVILQGRIDSVLIVESGQGAIDSNDLVMVQRGEDLYATYCLSCHGANLRGDGPLAETLNPPPSDFSAPHTKIHSDADLLYWIQNGMQGTAMPGFGSQLSDQDIRDIISFIKNWQQKQTP